MSCHLKWSCELLSEVLAIFAWTGKTCIVQRWLAEASLVCRVPTTPVVLYVATNAVLWSMSKSNAILVFISNPTLLDFWSLRICHRTLPTFCEAADILVIRLLITRRTNNVARQTAEIAATITEHHLRWLACGGRNTTCNGSHFSETEMGIGHPQFHRKRCAQHCYTRKCGDTSQLRTVHKYSFGDTVIVHAFIFGALRTRRQPPPQARTVLA